MVAQDDFIQGPTGGDECQEVCIKEIHVGAIFPVEIVAVDPGVTIGVTQSTSPWVISGTVTANQGSPPWSVSQSGTWNITNISGTISLPTGAATAVNQVIANTNNLASTSAVTRVASSGTNVSLLVANANRKAAYLFNESTQIAYVKLGTTATLTSYTVQVAALGFLVINMDPVYTGEIDALWSSANGAMQITELTA